VLPPQWLGQSIAQCHPLREEQVYHRHTDKAGDKNKERVSGDRIPQLRESASPYARTCISLLFFVLSSLRRLGVCRAASPRWWNPPTKRSNPFSGRYPDGGGRGLLAVFCERSSRRDHVEVSVLCRSLPTLKIRSIVSRRWHYLPANQIHGYRFGSGVRNERPPFLYPEAC
jgi:hypothetical protein